MFLSYLSEGPILQAGLLLYRPSVTQIPRLLNVVVLGGQCLTSIPMRTGLRVVSALIVRARHSANTAKGGVCARACIRGYMSNLTHSIFRIADTMPFTNTNLILILSRNSSLRLRQL